MQYMSWANEIFFLYNSLSMYKRLILGNTIWHCSQIGGNIKTGKIVSQGISDVGKEGLDSGSRGLISFQA